MNGSGNNNKRKKKVQYVSTGTSGESIKRSKDTKTFGTEFGMQMIADRLEMDGIN